MLRHVVYNGSRLKEGEQMKSKLKHIAIILLGSCILAFGMYNIHDQAKITEGGVLGLILLFQAWFPAECRSAEYIQLLPE